MKNEGLSAGKIAAIKRARLLTDFEWVPLRDFPAYSRSKGEKIIQKAGVPLSGMPYSTMELTDKFICENVSFETFVSIINNPDSALYTKDLGGGTNGKKWTYFGIVCNGFVRYAFGIKERINTKRWLQIPGMRLVAEAGCYTPEEIEICDVLHIFGTGRNHVVLVTDILCGDDGKVTGIEISEATPPLCRRELLDVDEFHRKYDTFALMRYDYIDSVPLYDASDEEILFDRELQPKLPKIAIDCGNKSNYTVGEEAVISVFSDTEDIVEIRRDGEVIEKITVKGPSNFARKFERGYYTLTNLTYGESIEFCFKKPEITHTVKDGIIEIKADPCDKESVLVHMDFRGKGEKEAGLVKTEKFTDEEKKTGVIRKPIPEEAQTYKINFENKYGMWTHQIIQIYE